MNTISNYQSQNKKKVLFPKSIATQTDSAAYTKKLIITAISNITYIRAIFPEDYYTERKFEGINCKIVKPPNSQLKESSILSDRLQGAFEAMDKKYLKCMSLSLYEDPNDIKNVLETYDFNIIYTGKDTQMVLNINEANLAGSKAKMNAVRLLRAIICISESLNDLPVRIFMNMRLFYYDDTPIDYEPPCFKSADFDKYNYENGKVRIDGGQCSSLWHQVTLNINVDHSMIREVSQFQTIDETFDNSSDMEENDSGIKTMSVKSHLTGEKGKKFKHIMDKTVDTLMDKSVMDIREENLDTEADSLSIVTKISAGTGNGNSSIRSSLESQKIVKCGCGLNDIQDDLFMFRCINCSNWQHAICYNFYIEKRSDFKLLKENIKFNCTTCCELDGKMPVDKTQENLSDTMIYEICVWRRVLQWLTGFKKNITLRIMSENFEIKPTLATQFVKRLENAKILNLISKKGKSYKIEHDRLKEFMIENFKMSVDDLSQEEIQFEKQKYLNKSVCFDLPEMQPSQIEPSQFKSDNLKVEQTVPTTQTIYDSDNTKKNVDKQTNGKENSFNKFNQFLGSDGEGDIDDKLRSPTKRKRKSSVSTDAIQS